MQKRFGLSDAGGSQNSENPRLEKLQQYFGRFCPTQMVNALAALAVILLSLKYHIGFTVVNFLTLI